MNSDNEKELMAEMKRNLSQREEAIKKTFAPLLKKSPAKINIKLKPIGAKVGSTANHEEDEKPEEEENEAELQSGVGEKPTPKIERSALSDVPLPAEYSLQSVLTPNEKELSSTEDNELISAIGLPTGPVANVIPPEVKEEESKAASPVLNEQDKEILSELKDVVKPAEEAKEEEERSDNYQVRVSECF